MAVVDEDGGRGFAIRAAPHLSPRSLRLPPARPLPTSRVRGAGAATPHREAVNVPRAALDQGQLCISGRLSEAPHHTAKRMAGPTRPAPPPAPKTTIAGLS